MFKTAQSQAGATFFWDLGAPFPVNRIRFFPAPDDDAFVKAFELRVNDGENFNDINRPQYELLRRVEVNRESTVDIEFAPLQGRFLQLRVLSKTVFNIAEFEIYGQGFVPVASYESALHSFGGPVNYGRLRVHATHLGTTGAATAAIQMRTGADDSPLAYFRRDRDTGRQAGGASSRIQHQLATALPIPPRPNHRRAVRGAGPGRLSQSTDRGARAGARFRQGRHPRRRGQLERVVAEHVYRRHGYC